MAKKVVAKNKASVQVGKSGGTQKLKNVNKAAKAEKGLAAKKDQRAKKSAHKSHKKGLIIGGAIILVLAVTGVICAIVLPPLFQPKYGESYEVAVDLKAWLEGYYGEKKAPCQDVVDSYNDETVSVDRFDDMVKKCKADITEGRELVAKLGESSGIMKDENLKKKYDQFAKTAKLTMPDDEKLAKEFKAYQAVHDFSVEIDEVDEDEFNEATVKRIAQILIDSDDDILVEVGEGFKTRSLKLVQLYHDFENASNSNDYSRYFELYSEIRDAADDYQDWMTDHAGMFNNKDRILDKDTVNAVKSDFDDLYKAIREMYEKHYDGKNEVECSKKGDGVKCK